MRRLWALCCAALAAGILCAGCAKPPGAGALARPSIPLPADTMTVGAAERGHYGGRFVIAETSDPKTFNVMMSNDQASNDIDRLMFTSLTEYDNREQRTIPNLARSWEHSPDGRVWTFHLRRGARFSDGVPITAYDVLFSFAVVYDDSLHPTMQDALKVNGKPFRVEAPDSMTVTIVVPGSHGIVRDARRAGARAAAPRAPGSLEAWRLRIGLRRFDGSRKPGDQRRLAARAPRARRADDTGAESLLVRRGSLGAASAVSRPSGLRDRSGPEHRGAQIPGR